MEVIQDTYKDTKIGRIPKDWEVIKIGDFSNVQRGASPRPIKDVRYFSDKGRGWIRISDVSKSYKYLTKTTQYLSELGASKSRIVDEGDIIMSICGSIGKPIIIGIPSCIHDGFVLFSKFKHKMLPEYLYYFLYFKEKYYIGLGQEGTQKNLNTSIVKKTTLGLPPLLEQQKIAAILSTVDEQISTTDKIIEKSKELKKGLMQKLFSEGIGHTEFKDTKIGRIPKDWEVLKINKVADCYGGTTPSTAVEEYWNGDVLWATPSDITKNKSEFLLDTNRKITEQGRVSKNLRFVQKNGLLMTSRASIGFLNISNGDVVTNQGFINIECKDNFHYKFFYYWVLDNRKKLLSLSQGSTFLELNRKTFAKINIPIPPLPEQQKIATILSEADAKIEKEQIQKAQLQALKKGLMQQLLTGKKRVNV
jgi:type I restriction enzyme S subunit